MAISPQPTSKPGDFNAVRKSIIDLLKQPEYDDGSAGPVLVRLAWYGLLSATPSCLINAANLSLFVFTGILLAHMTPQQAQGDQMVPVCDTRPKVAIQPTLDSKMLVCF